MPDEYMVKHILPGDRSWLNVAENCRNFGMQFTGQGQCHVHVSKGNAEPDEDVPFILASNILDETPRTFSVGQLPEDAVVWLRRSGDTNGDTEVTVLAY